MMKDLLKYSIVDLYFLLYALAISTIILDYGINSVCLILLFAVAIIIKLKNKAPRLSAIEVIKHPLTLISFFGFFCLISILWSIDMPLSIKGASVKLPLLIAPILLMQFPSPNRINPKHILLLFCLSVFGANYFCLVKSIFHFYVYRDQDVFFYHALSEQLSLNAIYLSLFNAISIYFIYFNDLFRLKQVKYFILVSNLVFLVLLSSKMIILAFLITSVFLIIRRKPLRNFILPVGFSALILLFILSSTSLKNRFEESIDVDFNSIMTESNLGYIPANGISVRLFQYRAFYEIFKERPSMMLSGFGLKTQKKILNDVYIRYNIANTDNQGGIVGLDFHNQYLCSFLASGILPFFALILFFIVSIRNSIRQRDGLVFCVSFMFAFAFMSEMYLETQRGTIFFLLVMIFLHNSNINKSNSYANWDFRY